MSAKVHDFQERLNYGAQCAAFLDDYFRQWYAIEEVGMEQERRGIDRIFTDLTLHKRHTVEYKCDARAKDTGNAFVEVVSVMAHPHFKWGWAWTCQADRLIYYVPGRGLLLIFFPARLRAHISQWGERYGYKAARNDGYVSLGIPVALAEFMKAADTVRTVGQ